MEESAQKGTTLHDLLANAKVVEVVTSEKLDELRRKATEEREDYKGSIELLRSYFSSLLRLEASRTPALSVSPTFISELATWKSAVETRLVALKEAGFQEDEVFRARGIAQFRALITFVNELETWADYDYAIEEAVRTENLKGPLSRRDEDDARARKQSLVTAHGRYYALCFPEKKTIRGLVTAFWKTFRNLKAADVVKNEERAKKIAETKATLQLVLKKGADGVVAFSVPWGVRGRNLSLYLELEFKNGSCTVNDASGDFTEMIGKTVKRGELPGSLFAATRRALDAGKAKIIPLNQKKGG